jgi:Radical SAM superfamily.
MNTDNAPFFPSEVWPDNMHSARAFIDIVDACNLRCPECIRGTRAMPNSNDSMPFDLFQKICAKLMSEKYTTVELFNWTEPFLHKDIAAFIAEAKQMGLRVQLSSNLSLKKIPSLIEVFAAGLDELHVSVSGFSNAVQQIYHRGSDVENIKNNLRAIVRYPEYAKKTTVKFLNFGYNAEDLKMFSVFASRYGMEFMEVAASGNPLSATGEKKYFVTIPPKVAVNFPSAAEYIYYNADAILNSNSLVCEVGIIPTIDHTGKAYLCCDRPNARIFCLGNYLDLSVEEMLLKLYMHPECANCSYKRTLHLSKQQKIQMHNIFFRETARRYV